MSERIAQRRKAQRKVFYWGWSVAAALHVILFLAWRESREVRVTLPNPDLETLNMVDPEFIPLDLFFGPPAIRNATGGISVEPPERFLEVDRLVILPGNCKALVKGSGAVVRGSVRLAVDETGRTDVRSVHQSTGYPCADVVLWRIAGDLWYRWLPNDEFPAPVELVQPLSFREKVGIQ